MSFFNIGSQQVSPGSRQIVSLPINSLVNKATFALPVHVIHGAKPGPVLFITGAVHGDEVMGTEIVGRVIEALRYRTITGTVIAVPIVNFFGLLNHCRYMPDKSDLNRSFPGSDKGSFADQLADLLTQEVVMRSHYGIDLHSATRHRTNLPQIRVAPDEPELLELAQQFSPPVIVISKVRHGSLRHCARNQGVKLLHYEAGEALRFDEAGIKIGVDGILRIMSHVGMLDHPLTDHCRQSVVARSSNWIRSPESGLLRGAVEIGTQVDELAVLAHISCPLRGASIPVLAGEAGIVIGRTNMPVVNRGDALFHIAHLNDTARPAIAVIDEDEII